MSAPITRPDGDGTPTRTLHLKCPTCKEPFETSLPVAVKDQGQGGLVNVLIPHTSTPCGHAVQLFVDMGFKVRGYTRIDFVNDEMPEPRTGPASPAGRPAPNHGSKFLKIDQLRDKDEELEVTRVVGGLIKDFATNIPEVKAVAVFDYEGYIIAKALREDIRLEDVSMIAASLMSQTGVMSEGLKLDALEDFTISSDKYKVTIIKNIELLIIIMYDRRIKEGLMKFHLKKLDGDVRAAVKAQMVLDAARAVDDGTG